MKAQTKRFLKTTIRNVQKSINGLGGERQCYVCNKQFRFFTKFAGGSKKISEFHRRMDIVGSDVDNFGCVYCDSHDRERHLFMFFDKLGLWDTVRGASVLHFAPEKHLSQRLMESQLQNYVRADLFPTAEGVTKIDATQVPFASGSFDLVIANHILEHIPNYLLALREFNRVLKPGGIGILQTPFSTMLRENFEDLNINTDDLRLFFHGQRDHVRTFGQHRFTKSLEEAGFDLQIAKHGDHFDGRATHRYGVNGKEDLIRVRKPLPESSVPSGV